MIRDISIWMLCSVMFSACGNVSPGPVATPNDPAPNGTAIAQGSFAGLNGKAVTGLASVYRDLNTGTHTVRIEGIAVPNEPALQVVAQANGETVLQAQLRAQTGTQNYVTSVTDSRKWDSVSIRSTQNAITPEYGKAQLINK